jgi:hypothetical protein
LRGIAFALLVLCQTGLLLMFAFAPSGLIGAGFIRERAIAAMQTMRPDAGYLCAGVH